MLSRVDIIKPGWPRGAATCSALLAACVCQTCNCLFKDLFLTFLCLALLKGAISPVSGRIISESWLQQPLAPQQCDTATSLHCCQGGLAIKVLAMSVLDFIHSIVTLKNHPVLDERRANCEPLLPYRWTIELECSKDRNLCNQWFCLLLAKLQPPNLCNHP